MDKEFIQVEDSTFEVKKYEPVETYQKSYYAIIPANVRYDERISPNAKLLYGEITALCNEKGYCWATNNYFAKLYKVSKETISRWIAKLIKYNYIKSKIYYIDDTKQIEKRHIFLCIDKNINTSQQINHDTIDELIKTPIDKKVKENTKDINNTINNTLEYKKEKKTPTPKIQYAEFVTMTEEEYNKLISEYKEGKTKAMIEKLNVFKGSGGKKYKSDYLAILNWVVDWANKNYKESIGDCKVVY